MPNDIKLDLRTLTRDSIGHTVDVNFFNTHVEYNRMLPIWERCRDFAEGEDVIKEKGEIYLPKPNGQKKSEYLKYLQRAQYFNATGRTLNAYDGLIFRKNPIYKYHDRSKKSSLDKEPDVKIQKRKDKLDKFFTNITNDGKTANQFLREIVKEVMTVNKVGVLVDFPSITDKDGNIPQLSQYDVEERELHPVVSMYEAETILNWYWELIDTHVVPRYILLREKMDSKDTFFVGNTTSEYFRYRILLLEDYIDENGAFNYRYKQIVFETSDNNNYKVVDVIYPLSDGKFINHIPFYILTDIGLDYRANLKSMIFDLVNVNKGHYVNSADWENELHWVGIKTLYLPGWNLQVNGQPRLGGALAGPRDTVPQLIEASSDSGIKEEMQKKEERMAVLGAERISQQGRYIASKETARINAQSESATLSSMSSSISGSMSEVFTFLLGWAGHGDIIVDVELNKDFYEDSITGEEILKWIEAYQTQGIAFETYYFNLDKREVFESGWSKEKELAALQNSDNGLLSIGDEKSVSLQERMDAMQKVLEENGISFEAKEPPKDPPVKEPDKE